MAILTTKRPTNRRKDVLYSHRRPKASLGRVVSHRLSGIGDQLYYFGAMVERNRRNIGRHIRKGYRRVFAAIFHAFGIVFGFIGRKIANGWNDIVLPFQKMRKSVKSLSIVMKNTETRGSKYRMERFRLFFKYGWLWNKFLIARLMNYMAPLVALALCIVVVGSVVNLNYAIEINYNGQTVGYVESEAVYDSARRIIQSRMINPDDSAMFQDDTTLRIAVVDRNKVSTQDVMAENLLTASGDVKPASGIYIGGTFYGASTAPDLVEQALENLKAPYQTVALQMDEEGVDVKFARTVETVNGVYPISSIKPYEELVAEITSATPRDIYYKAAVGESPYDIATKNGISLTRLQELNPTANLDKAIDSDATLLVAVSEPLLRVKTVKVEREVEAIPFQTKTTKNANFSVSQSFTRTEGEEGERIVTKEYEYAAGEKINETILSIEVTKEAIDREVVIGTKGNESGGSSVGTGEFLWPTGPYQFISRGWSSVHSGVDIAGVLGTHIFAADNGVVIVSEYANDYGNYIKIDHQNGLMTLYGHHSANLVQVGETVTKGQLIAFMGSTGRSTGSHLHFEVWVMGSRVDPQPYLGYTL